MSSRVVALPLALIVVCATPAQAATPQQHATAARKAEKRGDWKKALHEWQAAYRLDLNAEYLVAMGDCYAKLGNVAEARKKYEAYLADPLALPATTEKVKAKLAALDRPKSDALALALPTVPAAGAAKADPLAPPPLPSADASSALPLPSLDAVGKPASAAAATAKPAVATTMPGAASTSAVSHSEPGKAPAVAVDSIAARPVPVPTTSSARRTGAWVAAGVAVAALGGGLYAFSQSNSAHNDLTGSVHTGSAAQSLLDSANQNRTLSAVGFAGALVAAGVSTYLFAF